MLFRSHLPSLTSLLSPPFSPLPSLTSFLSLPSPPFSHLPSLTSLPSPPFSPFSHLTEDNASLARCSVASGSHSKQPLADPVGTCVHHSGFMFTYHRPFPPDTHDTSSLCPFILFFSHSFIFVNHRFNTLYSLSHDFHHFNLFLHWCVCVYVCVCVSAWRSRAGGSSPSQTNAPLPLKTLSPLNIDHTLHRAAGNQEHRGEGGWEGRKEREGGR